jgi:hypothetical protein
MKITYDPPPAPRGLISRLAESVIEAIEAFLAFLLPRGH